MARLVILRFEDDEDAEDFVNAIGRSATTLADMYKGFFTADGMFQTPTMFCDCTYRGDGWRRSEKHGWWLHVSCGRPSVGWGSNFRTIIGAGNDLLEKPSKNTFERINMVGRRDPETGEPRDGYE